MPQPLPSSANKLSRCCQQVFQALFHFDSRATALLFKDLSKAGVGQRAVELFDWLRRLEENHALRSLCDVYTYTAMIAQCIYQQVCTLRLRGRLLLAEVIREPVVPALTCNNRHPAGCGSCAGAGE